GAAAQCEGPQDPGESSRHGEAVYTHPPMRSALMLTSLLLIACSCSAVPIGGGTDSGPADGGSDAGFDAGFDAGPSYPPLTTEEVQVLTARPYHLTVPAGYDGGSAVPFVVLLHGYGATGMGQDTYFKLSQLAQARTFLL